MHTPCLSRTLNLRVDELCGGGVGAASHKVVILADITKGRSFLSYLVVEPYMEQGPCSMVELSEVAIEDHTKVNRRNGK